MEQQAFRDATKDDGSTNAANLAGDLHAMSQAHSAAAPEYRLAAGALPQITVGEDTEHGEPDAQSRSVVVVDKTHHKTHVLQMVDGKVEDVLTVGDATGKGPKMTPEGRFHITEKVMHPTWYPPASIGGHPDGPGPHNPLGPAKIRTDAFGGRILLHGTNAPDSIGKNASHGCIRHLPEDILKIYPLVQKGDAVYITKNFNGLHIKPEDFNPRKN